MAIVAKLFCSSSYIIWYDIIPSPFSLFSCYVPRRLKTYLKDNFSFVDIVVHTGTFCNTQCVFEGYSNISIAYVVGKLTSTFRIDTIIDKLRYNI